MLNNFFLILSFILVSISHAKNLKFCNDQNLINKFYKKNASLTELKECARKTKGYSVGFQTKRLNAFILDDKINNSIFYFSFPMIHNIDFYYYVNEKLVSYHNYSKVNNKGNEYVSINTIGKPNSTILAITNTQNSIQIPYITFDKQEIFNQFIKSKLLYDGFWFGLLFFASIFSLIIFFVKKNKEMLFYFCHIFSLVLIQAAFSGYFFSYFSFLPEYFKHRIVVLSCGFLTIGTVGLIAHNFSNQKKNLWFIKYYKSIMYIGVLHIIYSLMSYNQVTIKFTSYLTLLLSISTIIACFLSIYYKLKNSVPFLLSLSLFLFSSLAFTLKDLGILPINEIYINYIVKLSLLFEICILGFVIVKSIIAEEKLLREADYNKKLNENAKKIHHDIKSPLTSLNFLFETIKSKLAEDERKLGNMALTRIDDIINCLEKIAFNNSANNIIPTPIYPILSRIVSEKRLEYTSNLEIMITLSNKLGYGKFIKINQALFMRVISNLINNSIEAKKHNQKLNVKVISYTKNKECIIEIHDNGIGIKNKHIKNIFKPGFSHEKENGKGLGLSSSKEIINSFGGDIKVNSEERIGTLITISLPLVSCSDWFKEKLEISKNICILDDDKSIHSIWRSRLKDSGLKIVSLFSENDFIDFIKSNNLDDYYFLVDFEFVNSNRNGLDFIQEYQLFDNSCLVTSHYNDEKIQNQSLNAGIKIIPKDSASFIPIEIKGRICLKNSSIENNLSLN